MSETNEERHAPTTTDGWRLDLKRHIHDAHFDRSLRPILLVPGYGMNSFILGFHPKGTSFLRALCEAGHEVWTANLRGQGQAQRVRRDAGPPSLRRLAEQDLATALDTALAHTRTSATEVDLIGCSLGGSLSFAYLALVGRQKVGALVAIGSPLRWVEIPGILRAVFSSRTVAGALRISGSRRSARLAWPVARKLPQILSLYANADNIDLDHVGTMLASVEDPHPRTNRDIASWVKHGDMVLSGINVSEAMADEHGPLMLVAGNRDGIVPESVALSPRSLWGGDDVTVLRVGTPEKWYAHADLFVGNDAPEAVFEPIVAWLRARNA